MIEKIEKYLVESIKSFVITVTDGSCNFCPEDVLNNLMNKTITERFTRKWILAFSFGCYRCGLRVKI